MSLVVANDQDANGIIDNPKKEVERKSREINAAQAVRPNPERLWPLGCFLYCQYKLMIKLIGQFCPSDLLIILHNRGEVGVDLWVINDPHQLRRRPI
jgi:hypothetical protein